MNVGGGCKAVVTIVWVRFMEYGEFLCGKKFPLMLKATIIKLCKDNSFVWM